MESLLRITITWVWSFLYWMLFLVVYLGSFRRLSDQICHKVIRFWGKSALWLMGIELECVNPSTLEARIPRVVVVNHQSGLDIALGAAIAPPAFLVVGKKEIIYVPIFNLLWWAFGMIRIDRQNPEKAIHSLKGVADELVRNSRSLFIAPEGTRTPDGSILPFKKGAFHIALERGLPIYPVVISGEFELLPRGSVIPRKGKIRVKFLPPIATEGLKREELDKFVSEVRQKMIEAKEWMEL